MTLVVCAIFRNEAPYLREWIEFHRMVGVERFYLYQNLSDDDWESVLRPYIDAGIADVTDWPRSPPGQLHAYQHFIDRHKGESWWTAFIDCDEFLFSPSHATITRALASVSSPDWGAVGVNWMCFGSSGHMRRTKGLVTERFTVRPSENFAANLHIKSIVRMDRVEWVARNPHCFIVNGGTFDELGREVAGAFTVAPTHRALRINHYHTKSRREYMKRIARGRGGGGPPRSPCEFDLYQSPDVDDSIMSRFLPELKRRLIVAGVAESLPRTVPVQIVPGWEANPHSVGLRENNVIELRAMRPPFPGSETGLIGTKKLGDVRLSFEILAEPGTIFLAKIHQREQQNQTSDSYHLMGKGTRSYLARHNCVLSNFPVRTGVWASIAMVYRRGTLSLELNGEVRTRIEDDRLPSGYCFLGIKAGTARVRNVTVTTPTAAVIPPHDVLYDSRGTVQPDVSIITTVYDRVACLKRCIQSVQALHFENYEHIIVADAPPPSALGRIQALVRRLDDGRHRRRLVVLRSRTNDWGISPTAAGLSLASGSYVCFLSDDNGYTPDHFKKLVAALRRNPGIGFAYSGCHYAGRGILNAARPAYARIDLGQPLFRRELFDRHLGGILPFSERAWDWRMIELFMEKGVRWKHIRDATFVFRLAEYPHLMAERPHGRTIYPAR